MEQARPPPWAASPGSWSPPSTPTTAIAPERLAPIVDRAVKAGVHILVANGNTGEFYSLSTDEAVAMVEAAAEHIAGRAPLLCGIGRALPDAVRLAQGRAGRRRRRADDPPAARSLRGAARGGRLRPARRRGRRRPAAGALPAQRRAWEPRRSPISAPSRAWSAVKWATPNPMRMAEAAAAADAAHRLGGRPRRDLGAGALRRRRPRLHLRPDQRLAGALDGDPCRAGGRGLTPAPTP